MAVDLLTVSEYARHRGCDEKAVRKAIAEGRITRLGDERRCIDPEVADIQWAKNTRARVDSGREAKAPRGGRGQAPASEDGGDYWSARSRREHAEAAMAEIELAKARGAVLDKAEACSAVSTAFRQLRDQAMLLGRQLAPKLAPLTDVHEIRIEIERAQAEVLEAFAQRQMASLAQRLGAAEGEA